MTVSPITIGIVGSEAIKFTPVTEREARNLIRRILSQYDARPTVVSGACHLGGIDLWAAEIGRELGLDVVEHAPRTLSWETGYKPRNLLIAASDVTHCITVSELPPSYTGMRFKLCYHCGTDSHVKSGGCWTVKQARRLGRLGHVWVVDPHGGVQQYEQEGKGL